MREMKDELGLASKGGFKSKSDDFIDTISMLASLVTWRPSEEVLPMVQKDGDVWEDEDDGEEEGSMRSYVV
jgi:hypothetical protein